MRRLLLAAALLAACSKKAPAPPPGFSAYEDPGKLFSAAAPSDWRVLEASGGAQRVTFLGPPSGPAPFAAALSVYYYPKGAEFASPEDYAARHGGQGLAFETRTRRPRAHGRGFEDIHEKTVLVPAKGGFFALVHAAAAEDFERTGPVFAAFVASFR